MERRTFLKLLGLGTGALVKPDLMFGTADAAVRTPTEAGLAKSWVVYPDRRLGCNFGQLSLNAHEFVIQPDFPPGVDPHEVFYKAALELRERIGRVTLDRLAQVPQHLRAGVEIVNSVLMPIHARTRDAYTATGSMTPRDEDWAGFDVVADCAIEVKAYGIRGREERGERYGMGWTPSEGIEVYSTTGEYPMEMLGDLDLGHLMSIDKKFKEGDAGLHHRMSQVMVHMENEGPNVMPGTGLIS